jgi:hypothetical protein
MSFNSGCYDAIHDQGDLVTNQDGTHPLDAAVKPCEEALVDSTTHAHKMPTLYLQLQISPVISSDELLLLGRVFGVSRWAVRTVQS